MIDLDNDLLTLRKKNAESRRIRLHKLLQKNPVSIAVMKQSYPIPLPESTPIKDFQNPTWDHKVNVTPLQMTFISRVLEDFVYQWRHVFRSRYKDITFRKLACAIVRILTLDFTVREITGGRTGTGRVVWVADLPQWKPIPDHIIHFGLVSVFLCQHFAHAKTLIQDDFGNRRRQHRSSNPSSSGCVQRTYIVLSIREVFLYKTCTCGHATMYTKPERLFDGVDGPSKQGLGHLLMIASSTSYSVSSRLHSLPLEIQNIILDDVSLGRVESGRIGCLLALDTPFQWKGAHGTIQRQEVLTTRPRGLFVESQIWFDDYLSGLVYK